MNVYRPKLTPKSKEPLDDLSRDLNYIVTHGGVNFGNPSPPQMLEALATAYRRDPDATTTALRSIGVGKETAVTKD